MILERSANQYCEISKYKFRFVLYILRASKQRTDVHESKRIEELLQKLSEYRNTQTEFRPLVRVNSICRRISSYKFYLSKLFFLFLLIANIYR